MDLETDSDITFDREQVVNPDNVVLTCSKEESIVGGKSNAGNVRRMTVLVFFDQNERLEGSEQTWSTIDNETVILSDGKQFAVLTELSCDDHTFEVKLCNGE